MAVNLDQIHFYNPPQPKASLANPISGDAFNRSAQTSICTDRDGQQAPGPVRDFSNPIELSGDDDEDQVATVQCLSTAKRDGLSTEKAASSVSVVPLAAASPELPSACPGSHHIPATTAVTPDDFFQPDVTGRLLSQAFRCGHSTALTGANIADIRPPADNQPEPVLDPVSASPQQASQTVFPTSPGQIPSGDIETRDDEPRTPMRRLIPCVATTPEPDNETTTSDSSLAGQNGISLGAPPELFPILSSLSGLSGSHVIFGKKPAKPGHANYTATSLPSTMAPFQIGGQGERSASQFRSSRSQSDGALSSPIDLPRGPLRDRQARQDVLRCGGAASPRDRSAKDPAIPARWRTNNLLFRPKSKPTRRSDPDQSGPQRRSARLSSAIRQAPLDYHESSDSCSDDASGGDENYISDSADTERGEIDRTAGTDGPAPKRRRTLPSSTTLGGARRRSRPRPSWSSTRITDRRRARTRGIISPPTSCESSEPGSGEEGPVTTFEEWPLDRVTLKRVVDDGVATFQLQFSWDLCTKTGAHEKAPKTRRALPSEKRGPFTNEEDALIIELKERGISWKEIHREFTASHPGRSVGALQVRYCTKLKDRQT